MTPFLSMVTPRGAERVRRFRDAATREDLDALIKEMAKDLPAELAGNRPYTAADEYTYLFALAARTTEIPRASAASYDGAAHIALSARAFHEALFALEKAQNLRPCPERAKQIKALRHALLPAGTPVHEATERSSTRRRSTKRT